MPPTIAIIICILCVVGMAVIVAVDKFRGSLNVSMKTVGRGQYGTARWASSSEIRSAFPTVPYDPVNWRKGENLPQLPDGAFIIGFQPGHGMPRALIDRTDSHYMIVSTPGGGKTTSVAYPNMEFSCACGYSFLCTDTKGDLIHNYAGITKDCYGYTNYILDFKHPVKSDGFNMIQLVNKYLDRFEKAKNLADKARAERYAKITASTIVRSRGFDGGGQNAFFYDAAEGMIAAAILLVSEFGEPKQRHIVSVFKLLQELLQNGTGENSDLQKLMDMLPANHKAKWLAGSALSAAGDTMRSVLSTAMSRLLSFIDSEMEEILCRDAPVDTERICFDKAAVFVDFPEENPNTHFLVSLFISQFYREALEAADQAGNNRLPRRLMMFLDEFGTMKRIDNAKEMFTAARSRNIIIYPMIQSYEQLYENYGQHGGETILDSCAGLLFGACAPLSKGPEKVSRALGNRTVQSGSFSNSGSIATRNNSQNYQMIQRPLITPDEIHNLPREKWILTKTSLHPLLANMRRFDEVGIALNHPHICEPKESVTVEYADKDSLMRAVAKKYLKRQTFAMKEAAVPVPSPAPEESYESSLGNYVNGGM